MALPNQPIECISKNREEFFFVNFKLKNKKILKIFSINFRSTNSLFRVNFVMKYGNI